MITYIFTVLKIDERLKLVFHSRASYNMGRDLISVAKCNFRVVKQIGQQIKNNSFCKCHKKMKKLADSEIISTAFLGATPYFTLSVVYKDVCLNRRMII